jgi:hypothetical protein
VIKYVSRNSTVGEHGTTWGKAKRQVSEPTSSNGTVQDVAERPHSPFEVLQALLATEGTDDLPDARAVRIEAYRINAQVVDSVRRRVLDLAFAEAKHSDPRRAVCAVRAIAASLRYPGGLFNLQVSDCEREEWTPLFVNTINQLGDLSRTPDVDSAVVIAIREALWWHVLHSSTATQQAAEHVWAGLPDSEAHNLALVLHDGWGRFLPTGTDPPETQRIREGKFDEVSLPRSNSASSTSGMS